MNTKEEKSVIGARMMGGGFGGCTINLIKKDQLSSYTNFIKKQYFNKFKRNCSFYKIRLSKGTHLIKNTN